MRLPRPLPRTPRDWLATRSTACLTGALADKLAAARAAGRQLRVKLGIDPTAPDIHLGHAVVLGKLREFQDAGHRVVLIVGDYTARVGDPSGRSSLRPMLSEEEIEANAQTFQDQASRILDPDPERLEVRRNSEWLEMGMAELLKLVRTTTVAQLLEREDFAKRWSAREPISMLELMYPLLQGYDSVAVSADVELGGTDQKFNLLLGRDIQRAYGQPEQAIMTMPILVGTDGHQKMSKSLGNQIGVTDAPEEMYGKTLSIPDEAMGEYYRLLLHREPPGQEHLAARRQAGAGARARRLAALPRAGAAAESQFDRVLVELGRPSRWTRRASGPARTGRCTCPRTMRRGVRAVALGGPAADRAGRGVRSDDAGARGREEHDVGRWSAPTARVLKVGKRRFDVAR